MKLMSSVIEIVADALDIESDQISEVSSQNDIETWDSLATIQIINSVSGEFDLDIGIQDIGNFTSVERIIQYIETKVGG